MNSIPLQPTAPTAVALGTFDGLHPGHQAVIRAAVASGLPATVLSVLPSGVRFLTTDEERRRLLAQMGAAAFIPLALDEIRTMSPRAFFNEVLLARFGAKMLSCGFNFRFGQNAAGDTDLLARLCAEAGVRLAVADPVTQNGLPVSSTRIHNALAAGDMPTANALLGRPFGAALPVIHGNRLGHTLGFPTINQAWPDELALPRFGVYAVTVTVKGVTRKGVCNLGVRPTVGSDRVLCETHVLDLQEELYGQTADVRLLAFLREEKAFASPAELQAAIAADVAAVRAMP